MDDQTTSAAILPPLMRAGGELSPEAAAALCRHPNFAQAMRAVLTDNVSLYRGNRILNYVGYDRGRLVVAMLAFYLHASRRPGDPTSGLTAQSLKSLCVEQDVCSPGRARAMLSLLRLFGYIAAAPSGDRRFKLLAPTGLLTESLRQRWSAMFAAIALVLPEGAAAAPRWRAKRAASAATLLKCARIARRKTRVNALMTLALRQARRRAPPSRGTIFSAPSCAEGWITIAPVCVCSSSPRSSSCSPSAMPA